MLNDQFSAAMPLVMPLLLDALAIILEIRLPPDERIHQLLLLARSF